MERIREELSCTGRGWGDDWEGSGAAWARNAEMAEIPKQLALSAISC